MEHIYREGNGVIDDLAKVVHNVEGIKEWDDVSQTPPSTQMMVESECSLYGVV